MRPTTRSTWFAQVIADELATEAGAPLGRSPMTGCPTCHDTRRYRRDESSWFRCDCAPGGHAMTHPLIDHADTLAACQRERDQARAEVARLRGELEEYIIDLTDTAYYGDARWAREAAIELRHILDPGPPTCPRCGGAGWESNPDDGGQTADRCSLGCPEPAPPPRASTPLTPDDIDGVPF